MESWVKLFFLFPRFNATVRLTPCVRIDVASKNQKKGRRKGDRWEKPGLYLTVSVTVQFLFY